jgi:nitroreductase
MKTNPVIDVLMRRASVRRYTDEDPSDDIIEAIVCAGQQAPFAYQLYSVLLSRTKENNPFGAPVLFTICVDSHKLECIMKRRGWKMITNDLTLLLFGTQDAAYMAQNMVIAAESMGLGSCFIGSAPYRAEEIIRDYSLPARVFPLVQLALGYPAEDEIPRPRYPLSFTLFENTYPSFSDDDIRAAMREMDDGYAAQDYYRRLGAHIGLDSTHHEAHAGSPYSWTEHISRKAGQWHSSSEEIIEQFRKCGFLVD